MYVIVNGIELVEYCIKVLKNKTFQIQDGKGDVTITNDGATILKQMQVLHPAARMVSVHECFGF